MLVKTNFYNVVKLKTMLVKYIYHIYIYLSLLMSFINQIRWKKLDTSNLQVCMLSHSVVSDSLWLFGLWPSSLLCSLDFSGKNTGVSCHLLPPGDLPDPGIKPVSSLSPASQEDSLPTESSNRLKLWIIVVLLWFYF